jgi:2-hydroxychromene-2-carboxylate isomerase
VRLLARLHPAAVGQVREAGGQQEERMGSLSEHDKKMLRRHGTPLMEAHLVRFFEQCGGRAAKAFIADNVGLDTAYAQALLAGMVERGVLKDEGDALVLTTGST